MQPLRDFGQLQRSSVNGHSGVSRGSQFELDFAANMNRHRTFPYVTLREGLAQVIRDYGARGERPLPRTFLSSLLFNKIVELLGPEGGDPELYDSLDTSLDGHHGTDGFFILNGYFLTFDLSLWKTPDDIKADVLISQERLTYSNSMRNLSRLIIRLLKEQRHDRRVPRI